MALSITHQYVSAIADAGDSSVVQPSDWNAAHTLSGLGTGVEDFLATPSSANLAAAVTDETGSGALVFGTAPSFLTSITTPVATITQGTITDPAVLLNMTSTWNDVADTFTAIKLDVTNTNSADASLLMDLRVGAATKFSISKLGNIVTPSQLQINPGAGGDFERFTFNGATLCLATTTLSFSATGVASADLYVRRDAANTLALRNSTTAQTFNIYNTWTDASNYEKTKLEWSSNVFRFYTIPAGSGTARSFEIGAVTAGTADGSGVACYPDGHIEFNRVGTATRWTINTSGFLMAGADNTYDIGASGATRPRTGYFGTSVVTPIATITQGTITDVAAQINGTATWNDAADTMLGWKLNVTDTASSVTSTLLDIQSGTSGGTRIFGVRRWAASGTKYDRTELEFTQYAYVVNNAVGGFLAICQGDNQTAGMTLTNVVTTTSAGGYAWCDNATNVPAGTADTFLRRDAANTVAQRNTTASQTHNHYDTYTSSTDYHRVALKTARATLASVSGATVTATGLIPDGAVVVGVTTKVTVTISNGGGTTGFQVGTGGDPDRWGEAVALTAGTSLDNTNWTAGTIEAFTAATDVIVTAVGGNFNGTGTIYLSVQYLIGQCD
jgi:hypothetical protein